MGWAWACDTVGRWSRELGVRACPYRWCVAVDAIKILAWNILHGGGTARRPGIVLALLRHAPDVIVLTEFRGTQGGQIAAALADHGYDHHVTTPNPGRANGILIASKEPVELRSEFRCAKAFAGRFLDAVLPERGVLITGVHIPDDSRPGDKAAYWQMLLELGRARLQEQWVVMGDLNSGRPGIDEDGRTLACAQLLGQFATLGYRDAWRDKNLGSTERSWYSHVGTGFRIDAAFVSPSLSDKVRSAAFSHVEREEGISDHSLLVVELAGVRREPSRKRSSIGGLFAAVEAGTKGGEGSRG